MSELKHWKYELGSNPREWADQTYCRYEDALAAIEEARREEREAIQEIVYKLTDKERVIGDMIMSAISKRSRGSAKDAFHAPSWHLDELPKKACTCGDPPGYVRHAPSCPCYDAPAKPALPEEIPLGDGIDRSWVSYFNLLIRYLKAESIREELRRSK